MPNATRSAREEKGKGISTRDVVNMGDVVDLPVITRLDQDADKMLESAKGRLDEIVIVGLDKHGNEYFSSNKSDGATALWHLERAKYKLLKLQDEWEGV